MKIILIGKGESVNLISKSIILSHDKIAWANIHDHIKHSDRIPNKVDFLFIREKKFVEDLTAEQKNALNDLNILHVLGTGRQRNFKKILKYNVEEHLSHDKPFGFNASTGLIAFNHLVNLKPKVLTICGLDLFEKNKNLYYFGDVDNSLSSKLNNRNLKKITNNGILIGGVGHGPSETIEFIKKKIIQNPEIKFVFYTTNDNLKTNLDKIKNVEVK